MCVLVYCVINNASIRLSTKFQNARCSRAAVNRQDYFLIYCSILKESCSIAIIRRKFYVNKLKSSSRLSTNYRNTAFWLLEAGTRIADVPRSFGCNGQTIYHLQTRFQQPSSKNDKPPSGRPRITTPLGVRVIVTSTWRYRFMAAWKLLKHIRHATGTRISVYTARNRLRGARLIFELWNLNFDNDPFA